MNRLQAGAPAQKLILAIPTAARTWKLDADSEIAGVPPLHADGPGEAGMSPSVVFYSICDYGSTSFRIRLTCRTSDIIGAQNGRTALCIPENAQSIK